MKEFYKNPTFYYFLVPIALTLWPLLVCTVYLPNSEDNWKLKTAQYDKAQKIMLEILTLDPDRLAYADPKGSGTEFDYASAVEKVADLCSIPSSKYKLSSSPIIKSSGRKSQNARVTLNEVGVSAFAKFLSTIQLRWASLQCTQVKLTKKKGLPDTWKADIELKYYY